jgi:hypothetical protein
VKLVAALCWSALVAAASSPLPALEGGQGAIPSATSGPGPASPPGFQQPSQAQAQAQAQAEADWLAYVREHRDGDRLDEARLYLDRLIAAELREPALIEPTRHRLRLVAAANAGSLSAAARLVALSWWNAMQRVDISRPSVAAWKESDQPCGALVAGQVYAQLWLEHQGRHLIQADAFTPEVRSRWLALAGRWPLRHPVLLANACWLCLGNAPALSARGDLYLQQALVALANDPLLEGDDLLASEGCALAYARFAPQIAAEDREAACAIFAGAFARNSERGAWAAAGIDRSAQAMLRFSWSAAGLALVCDGLAEAETLYARAGDIVRQGRCQIQLVDYHRFQIPSPGPEEWAALDVRYRGAADLCRRSGDWLGYATAMMDLGWCMISRDNMAASDWRRLAEVFGEAAIASTRADDPQQRAYCLRAQVRCLVQDKGTAVDGKAVATLQREAEASFALTEVVFDRVVNLCDLGDTLGSQADRGAARQAYQQAAELVRRSGFKHEELLRRVRSGLHDFAE